MSKPFTIFELSYANWNEPTALFSPFANEPWAMLFDSANAQHVNSRFDILVRQPRFKITQQQGRCNVSPALPSTPLPSTQSNAQDDSTKSSDFFAHINAAMQTLAPLELSAEQQQWAANLPFLGGALGYLGYDLARTLEAIPEHAIADIDLPDAAMGIYQHALVIDHDRQRTFALAPVDWSLAEVERFWRGPAQHHPAFHLTAGWQSNMNRADYLQRIDRIHDYLTAGDCYQINLAQRFSAPCSGSSWNAYLALRKANRAPFSGYICLPQGAVLSVSPERFLSVSTNGKVETKPIKGTRPRNTDPAQDQASANALLASEKDRAENLMIVDLLRNDISRVCAPGSVKVPHLFRLESFPAVHHLVSTVTGQLEPPHTALDLMRAAFPGGSITGAPKVRAMEIIEELEPHRRSVYCGSFAYFSVHGRSDSSITIRTLCRTGEHIHCWAGGGIVIDSVGEQEYQETFDKVAKILPTLEKSTAGNE